MRAANIAKKRTDIQSFAIDRSRNLKNLPASCGSRRRENDGAAGSMPPLYGVTWTRLFVKKCAPLCVVQLDKPVPTDEAADEGAPNIPVCCVRSRAAYRPPRPLP